MWYAYYQTVIKYLTITTIIHVFVWDVWPNRHPKFSRRHEKTNVFVKIHEISWAWRVVNFDAWLGVVQMIARHSWLARIHKNGKPRSWVYWNQNDQLHHCASEKDEPTEIWSWVYWNQNDQLNHCASEEDEPTEIWSWKVVTERLPYSQ